MSVEMRSYTYSPLIPIDLDDITVEPVVQEPRLTFCQKLYRNLFSEHRVAYEDGLDVDVAEVIIPEPEPRCDVMSCVCTRDIIADIKVDVPEFIKCHGFYYNVFFQCYKIIYNPVTKHRTCNDQAYYALRNSELMVCNMCLTRISPSSLICHLKIKFDDQSKCYTCHSSEEREVGCKQFIKSMTDEYVELYKIELDKLFLAVLKIPVLNEIRERNGVCVYHPKQNKQLILLNYRTNVKKCILCKQTSKINNPFNCKHLICAECHYRVHSCTRSNCPWCRIDKMLTPAI